MDDDTGLLLDLPSVGGKNVSAAFDGARIGSDGGGALLALADRRIGIVDHIAALIADPRDPALAILAYLERGEPQRVAAHNLLRLAPMRVRSFGLYSSWRGRGQAYRLERDYPLSE